MVGSRLILTEVGTMIDIEEDCSSSTQGSTHVLQDDGDPLLSFVDPASRSGTIALGTS